MDGFKEIKHKQDQRLKKCTHAQEALTQCIGTNTDWYHLDYQHWFWSLHHPQSIRDNPEKKSAPPAPGHNQCHHSLSLSTSAAAQPQWLGQGRAAPGKAGNKLRVLTIPRLVSQLTLLTILLNYTVFFLHEINWHPNKKHYFTCLRLHFSPNQCWPCHRSYFKKTCLCIKKDCTPGEPPETQHLTVKSVPGKAETNITCEEKQNKQYWRSCINQIWLRKKRITQSKG